MPTNPELSDATAEAHAYQVRILADGDELELPFAIHSGKDYAIGEPLQKVAKRIADDLMDRTESTGIARDSYEVIIRDVPGFDCTEDGDPIDLASAVSYRW